MATITTGQRAITTGQARIRWQKVWAVLVAVFWVAIVEGIIGGFFLHWSWTGFPWTTYQIQAVPGSALNMWFAVLVATAIALFTAAAYAALAKRYPEAGPGSSYYFAKASVLQKEEHRHFKFARLSKFVVGWASHLYYWVYPGVVVAFMGLLITYIIQTFVPSFGTPLQQIVVCVVFACIVGTIAYIGVTGSTFVNIIINVIQIIALVTFSVLAIAYRLQHPEIHYLHPSALSVITPHDLSGLIFHSTIAILLVVGFESATALAAEAKNPGRDIPRGPRVAQRDSIVEQKRKKLTGHVF